MKWNVVRGLLAALLLACGPPVFATGLQVAPVGLELTPANPAQGLWLTNTGGDALHAQVRVFHWTQVDGKDVLTPTQALVASPPMLNLAPGAQQLVRVIRTGAAAANTTEDAYRLLVDELPPSDLQKNTGVRYVLRYSIPVFAGSGAATDDSTAGAALQWTLLRAEDGSATLQIRNGGVRHAQLADVVLQPPGGEAVTLSAGLLGYVLPGSTMLWPLKVPAAQFVNGTMVKVSVNGKPVEHAVAIGMPR